MESGGCVRWVAGLRDNGRSGQRERRALRPVRGDAAAQLHVGGERAARVFDDLFALDVVRYGTIISCAAFQESGARKNARTARDERQSHAFAEYGEGYGPEKTMR